MVAQVLVPAMQTVTLVVSMLRVMPGDTPTVTGCTFGRFDCGTFVPRGVLDGEPLVLGDGVLLDGVEPVVDVFDELPPPPPQPARTAQTNKSRVGTRKSNFMGGRSSAGAEGRLRGD
jgi:hypothetical protein